MSNLMFGPAPELGWVDKRRSTDPGTTTPVGTIANYASVSAIESRLTTIDANGYSAANLASMNLNDKIWALRQADDSAGI